MSRRVVLVALVTLLVASTAAFFPPDRCAEPLVRVAPDGSRHFTGGELRYVENIPFLRLTGGYYEMGYQYGVLMRDELQEAFQSYNLLRASILGKYPWYVRPFGRLALRMMAKYQWRRVPQKFKDELRGLSEGSGLAYQDILFSAVFLEIASAYCTSIIQRTETGIIHGRNLDFQPLFLARYPIVVEYNAEGKHRCVSFGVIGYTGIFTGINEKGLSVSLNSAFGYKRNVRDIPMAFKVRAMLEESSTIAELDRDLQEYQVNTGWIMSVGSAVEGDGVAYDLCLDKVVKTPLAARGDCLFSLNRYVDAEVTRHYTPISVGASYYNLARQDRIDRFRRERGIGSVQDMLEILSNADFGPHRDLIGTGNGTINNERTFQTVIFDLAGRTVHCAFARGYAGWARFIRYDLDSREAVFYRAEDERLRDPALLAYLGWYEQGEIQLLKGEYAAVAGRTLQAGRLNPVQLVALDMVREIEEDSVDPAAYLAAIDEAIARYKDYGLLYQLRGELLLSLGRVEEAIGTLDEGLRVAMVFPVEKMLIHGLLVEAYHSKRDKERSALHARECLNLLDELGKEFALGADERALQRAMLRIVAAAGSPADAGATATMNQSG